MHRSSRAFTLIEVMAAVFMLGLFVAAISQLLTQARRNEGHARLQAHAAELADRAIAEIEEGIARGTPPALGERETGDERWRVVTRVAPFDVRALVPAAAPDEQRGAARPDDASAGGWLAAPGMEENPPVLEIDVRVSWDGAPVDAVSGEPFAIRRVSFALNPAALETLASDGAEDAGGDEGGEE